MRVVLCDDHALFAEAMASALRSRGVDVVAVSSEPALAVVVAAALAPDVCLMDVGFPGEDGIAAIDRILSASPHTCVVMCSACSDRPTIAGALEAGARGYFSKTLDLAVIVSGLDRVMQGE
ncbi:MAG TPA: response regulator transcription factor, partial [Gemmatimonadaceae bacterium]